MLGSLIVSGFVSGSIYVLITVGLVVIYRSSRVINFAHGYVASVAAFVGLGVITRGEQTSVWIALPIAVLAAVLVSLLVEMLVITPLRDEPPLIPVVATLGVSLILSGLLQFAVGQGIHVMPPLVEGQAFTIFGYTLSWQQVIIVATTFTCVALLAVFLTFTVYGTGMRAVSENRSVSSLLGINLRQVSFLSWGLGGALAGLAAFLIAPETALTPDAFTAILLHSFVAVVLAGFTSILGAIAGGYLAGISINLFAGYVTGGLQETFLLCLLLVVLLSRPHGLFGKPELGGAL